jgi:hypothetical protein
MLGYVGRTVFFSKPGEREEQRCRVCGTACKVESNCLGPTCFAEAAMNGAHLHDRFECPNNNEMWHEKSLRIFSALIECASPTLRQIIKSDLFNSLKDHVGKDCVDCLDKGNPCK